MELIKGAWLISELGAVVLGLREVANVTPIVDIAGADALTAFAGLAVLGGAVSLLDKYDAILD